MGLSALGEHMSTNPPPLLEMRAISKQFSGVTALQQVHLCLYPGEVLALMGENGAGKSTLMKVLVGAYQPTEGQIFMDGKPVHMKNPSAARNMGVHLIYQEPNLAEQMRVYENIFMGAEKTRFGLLSREEMRRITRGVLQQLGASFGPDTVVETLSRAEGQLVEIARALAFKPRVLVLDEPTAALSEHETQRLFETIHKLREQGLGIVYITHRMAEVYTLADRISVLRNGQLVGTLQHRRPQENTSSMDPRRASINAERLINMMLGQALNEFQKPASLPIHRKTVLELRGVTDGQKIKPLSMVMRAGEIVALTGLVGSGRTELARLLAGISPIKQGKLWLEEALLSLRSPRDAVQAGIVYAPEDRVNHGLFSNMTVAENISAGVLEKHSRLGFLNTPGIGKEVKDALSQMNLRLSSVRQPASSLSGGNQQKLLLARYLALKPKVLILDEPTSGIDVAARAELYRTLSALAQQGVSILFITSELAEVARIADRVLVLRDGELMGEIDPLRGEVISQEHIMEFATGLVKFTPEDWKKRHPL